MAKESQYFTNIGRGIYCKTHKYDIKEELNNGFKNALYLMNSEIEAQMEAEKRNNNIDRCCK